MDSESISYKMDSESVSILRCSSLVGAPAALLVHRVGVSFAGSTTRPRSHLGRLRKQVERQVFVDGLEQVCATKRSVPTHRLVMCLTPVGMVTSLTMRGTERGFGRNFGRSAANDPRRVWGKRITPTAAVRGP